MTIASTVYTLHSTLTQYKHPLTLSTDGICTHFSWYQVSTNLNGFACKLHQHTHIAFDAWKYPNFKCPAECKWSCVLLYLVLYGKCTVHSIRLVLVQRKQKKKTALKRSNSILSILSLISSFTSNSTNCNYIVHRRVSAVTFISECFVRFHVLRCMFGLIFSYSESQPVLVDTICMD